jgi:endonuclease/exonuclease/phosphatase family metal-dependent hydrolase
VVTRTWLFLFIILLSRPLLHAQDPRIASYNMERLGQDRKDYPALAAVVARYDLVAAEEVMNAGGMATLLASMGPGWSDFMSPEGEGSRAYKEHFGFFFDAAVDLVTVLGEYPGRAFFRPPFAVRFRVKASGFAFTIVACHIVYGKSKNARVAENSHLGEVYRWFEDRTGRDGSTVIVGDFNDEQSMDFSTLEAFGDRDVLPGTGTTIGIRGPDHDYDHIFVPPSLLPRVEAAAVDYWTTDYSDTRKAVSDHFPVYVRLKVSR